MTDRYILIGQTPVPCEDLMKWASWYESADQHVWYTRVGPYVVSTVFLAIDHNFHRMMGNETAPPILFETMVFTEATGKFTDVQERCSTWAEAELQHKAVIAALLKLGNYEVTELGK